MLKTTDEYLVALQKNLKKHPGQEDILLEYESFIYDKLQDYMKSGYTKQQAEAIVVQELPCPEDLAKYYKSFIPPKFKQIMLFSFIVNFIFFIIGGIITFLYHQFSNPTVIILWSYLIEMQWVILFLYSAFVVSIGFLIGKEFGSRFNRYIKKILFLTFSPNILFMIMVLYSWVPQKLFEPMLTPAFLMFCVILTLLYYPLSKVAYKIGQLQL
ncbi:hypothetical protein BKP35_00810 [Anaerobacillus arseniciselenatis]|uniref:DUF1700 domain-containing protein n=1 Tax=Anaerobacillus arseniciselenatis TaxID=85682 RepID=A0A1S2LSS7_9BACI|nr:hypothetical protein [Anaerobacillus arseniciselenatis]OIJ15568.1 hypothetical protein BKP35_00810 [Anaerobacillus arseniciselenatis]